MSVRKVVSIVKLYCITIRKVVSIVKLYCITIRKVVSIVKHYCITKSIHLSEMIMLPKMTFPFIYRCQYRSIMVIYSEILSGVQKEYQ